MEQLQLKDFLNYRFLSGVRYAPGGKRAAFVVANCNEEENSYESRLWMYDGQLRQLTDLGKEGQYVWEDETHILFPAVRSAAEQKRQKAGEQFTSFYRLDVTGGEALPAFTLPFKASELRKLGDGKWLAMGSIDAGCPDYYQMAAEEREKADKAKEKEKDYEVFDETPFWSNGRGVTNKLRRALFVYNPADGSCKRLTDPLFQTSSFEVMGDTVYFLGNRYESRAVRSRSTLYAYDVPSGEVKKVTEYIDFRAHDLVAVGGRLLLLGLLLAALVLGLAAVLAGGSGLAAVVLAALAALLGLGLLAALGGLGRLCLGGGLGLPVHLGKDALQAVHLVVLGQILKDQGQLPVVQGLHVVLGRGRIFGQDVGDLLGVLTEVLGHLVHAILVVQQKSHLHWRACTNRKTQRRRCAFLLEQTHVVANVFSPSHGVLFFFLPGPRFFGAARRAGSPCPAGGGAQGFFFSCSSFFSWARCSRWRWSCLSALSRSASAAGP